MIRLIRDMIISIAALYIIVIGLSWAFETLAGNGMMLPAALIFIVSFGITHAIFFTKRKK